MIFLFFVVAVLILGGVLLLMLVGGVITLFAEKPVRIKKPSRKIEISTVNSFENAVPKKSNVSQ